MNEFTLPMSFLNWNVRGLGDLNKCAVIKELVTESHPDIVCFQQTKWSDCTIFNSRQVCPSKFRHIAALNAKGTKGN